jgi:hypothetical protein
MVSSFDAVEVRRLRQQSPYDPSIGRVGNSFVLTCRPELNWHVDIEWIDFRVALVGLVVRCISILSPAVATSLAPSHTW